MRQLAIMAETIGRERWDHTSAILAMLNNANPHRKENLKPSQLNPYLIRDRKRHPPAAELPLGKEGILKLFGGKAPQIMPPRPMGHR
jgi:hypothetical protein